MKAKKYNYKGKMYSLRELVELTNIKYNTLLYRLHEGLSIQDAVAKPVRQHKNKYKYDSNFYTLSELMQFTTLPKNIVSYRLRNGWTTKDALTKHVKKRKPEEEYFKDDLNLDEMIKNGLNRPSKYDVDNTKWIKEIMK